MKEDIKKQAKQQKVRVRIAPSPTGALHIGTARAALFNFLFAKKNNGIFILRIEDTDTERSQKKWEEDIIEGLKWLGLNWQEGPILQSQRTEIYKKYIKQLIDDKKVYYCFCTREELEAQRQHLMSIGKPPGYQGACRELSSKQVEENLSQKKPFVLRIKAPNKKIIFEDIIRGKIETHSDNFGDMVIAKGDSQPLYNLAVVIDDFEMKISHIIRGEDHISNTPKQILIAQALGIESPKYAHLPLVLGTDRSKMSKRHGATSITQYKEQGYLKEALINFLALLGWNPGDDREIFSLSELVQEFSLEKVQKSGAVFNIEKLNWLNGAYIRKMPIDELTTACLPYLIKANFIKPLSSGVGDPPAPQSEAWRARTNPATAEYEMTELNQKVSFQKISQVIALYQERLKRLNEIPELVNFFFKKDLDYDRGLLAWKNMSDKEIKTSLDTSAKLLQNIDDNNWTAENIQKVLIDYTEAGPPTSLREVRRVKSRGELLWPLRVALSGKKASASPFDLADFLGKSASILKIHQAIDKLR